MSRFAVEVHELESLRRALGSVHERLMRVTTMMSSLGAATTGHRGLAAALDDFSEEWHFSLGKVQEHTAGLEAMVSQAADAYRAVDAEVARAARG